MNRNVDTEKYRRHNESDRQWKLKKIFIERYINQYDEDRLLCLAQCFVNTQTIGCRYSLKIMNQIQEMSKELEPHIQEQTSLSNHQNTKKQNHQNIQSKKMESNPEKQPNKEEQKFTDRKPKLISKTHLTEDREIRIKQTPKPKIQILTRETGSPASNSNQTTQSISYKNALITSNSSQQLKSKTVQSPSVPASTSELAPAASTLPIPFGLSPILKESSRNALLKMIKSEEKKPNDPLSALIGCGSLAINNSPRCEDLKFSRLSKINKLRDTLRSKKIVFDDNFDIIEFFDDICLKNNIQINYNQTFENDFYFGEFFIETFSLVRENNRKKKKCKKNTYQRVYDILISNSELAVKLAKDQSFEYELYVVDNEIGLKNKNSTVNNINDLNSMLKLLKVPRDNNPNDQTQNDSKESQCPIEEDNDEESIKSPSLGKKDKIKKKLGTFYLFVQSNDKTQEIDGANLDNYIHERNSIQILSNSCTKSNCKLEFEIKNKGESDQAIKKIVSADQIEVESDNEDVASNDKKQIKCKCFINEMKISSAYSVSKSESKRLSALKAIRYLAKLFPVLKETNYQQLNNQKSSDESSSKFHMITNENLFGTCLPMTIFDTPLNSLDSCSASANFSNQSFGEKMLKKMGWKGEGHGLGLEEQGILKPIEFVDMNRSRFGFGYNYHSCDGYDDELKELECTDDFSSLNLNQNEETNKPPKENHKPKNKIKIHQFISNIRKLLNDFVHSTTEKDLVFDKNLSIEDRKIIHKEAHRYGLKTRSEGNGTDRFIVVKKKKTSNEIFDSVLKNGGELNKFSIISHGDLID